MVGARGFEGLVLVWVVVVAVVVVAAAVVIEGWT